MIIKSVENKTHLSQIVSLHMEIFDGYFLKNLGSKLLLNYYGQFIENDDTIFLSANDENDNAIGFILITSKYSSTISRFYRKYGLQIVCKIVQEIFKGNKIIIKGLKIRIKRFFKKQNLNFTEDKTVLLSLGVVNSYRGKEISNKLIFAVEKILIANGVQKYGLSVKSNNIGAKKFYAKMQFYKIGASKDLEYFRKDL